MNKSYINSDIHKLSGLVELSFLSNDGDDSNCDTNKTSKKLFRVANLLPGDKCMGIQIDTDKDGKPHIFAFPDSDETVTQEDFDWIFEKCARTTISSLNIDESAPEHNRRIYLLSYDSSPEKKADKYVDDYWEYEAKRVAQDHLFEAIDKLIAIRASIRIVVKGGQEQRGMILVILPGMMSLRVQAMLTFGCPDTSLVELTELDKLDNEEYYLPKQCLVDTMTGVLDYMVQKYPMKKSERISDEAFMLDEGDLDEEFVFDEEKSKDYSAFSSMSIEELNLSIRAYNCLRRAGIHTAADLMEKTDEELMGIRNLGKKSYEEVKEKLAEIKMQAPQLEEPEKSYTEMLDNLIGLKNVKDQVRKITAFARMKQDMESTDQRTEPIVLNMEFIGNPGTAKTTVARIIAGILNEIGLLKSNELVEVGRADLIAKYEGQTADKVKNVFRQAKGKLLFIDEAYSLVENWKGEFGDEAINTIVQEMENNRQDTVVIFAGYPEEMKEFFSRNPGLRSRVPFTISFLDYSSEEMVSITELEAEKRGFSVSAEAKEELTAVCQKAMAHSEIGNGRFCRNLAENAILNYALRVYGNEDNLAKKDFTLYPDDFRIPDQMKLQPENKVKIGFKV